MLIFQRRRVGSSYDANAQAYITAVEAADGQSLETAVKDAINAFVVDCKADGTWSAIKSACIMAGARTLSGALVPLVGSAPTNNGPFVSGDYNRKTGLISNGTTKYLSTNRAGNADPQNDYHLAVYITTAVTTTGYPICIGSSNTTLCIGVRRGDNQKFYFRANNNASDDVGSNSAGLAGMSRASSTSYTARTNGTSQTISNTSTGTSTFPINVFAGSANSSGSPAEVGNFRLSFYSSGTSLTLASLESRLSTLMTALAAAIP